MAKITFYGFKRIMAQYDDERIIYCGIMEVLKIKMVISQGNYNTWIELITPLGSLTR